MSSDPGVLPSRQRSDAYRFPPGPGVNLLVSALKQKRWVDPIAHFSGLVQRFGDIAHYMLGPRHILFLNHPELIREIFIVQHSKFVKERTQQRARLLLGQGMITADGAVHKQQRQAAQPAFHRRHLPVHADEIVRRTALVRDSWANGEQRDLYTEMMLLTLGIVGGTLFRTDLGNEVHDVNRAMADIMRVYNAVVLLPGVRLLLNVPFTPLRKFVHAKRRLHETAERMIQEHRRRGPDASGSDLLTMLIDAQQTYGWSEEHLRDQVITVFLAGYETTAIALTWTWYLLTKNPEAEQRMHDEVDSVLGGRPATFDDLPRLKYTEMVMAEAMRLYPPAWAMGRLATEDFELAEWHLPAGTTVLASQFILHRDERFFPDPLRFDPERHTPEAKAKRVRGAYFPFGMGPRQCIGESFAWMEGILVLATIAQRWRFRLVSQHEVEPEPLFTLRPRGGMKMRIGAR